MSSTTKTSPCKTTSPKVTYLPYTFTKTCKQPNLHDLSSRQYTLPIQLIFTCRRFPCRELYHHSITRPSYHQCQRQVPFQRNIRSARSLCRSKEENKCQRETQSKTLITSLIYGESTFRSSQTKEDQLPSPSTYPSISLYKEERFRHL